MPNVGAGGSCFLDIPDPQRLASMQDACVSKWMVRMAEPESCVAYFSGVASPACSAADLRGACEETSRRFAKRDAENLCENLQAAHQDFWPTFWKGERRRESPRFLTASVSPDYFPPTRPLHL